MLVLPTPPGRSASGDNAPHGGCHKLKVQVDVPSRRTTGGLPVLVVPRPGRSCRTVRRRSPAPGPRSRSPPSAYCRAGRRRKSPGGLPGSRCAVSSAPHEPRQWTQGWSGVRLTPACALWRVCRVVRRPHATSHLRIRRVEPRQHSELRWPEVRALWCGTPVGSRHGRDFDRDRPGAPLSRHWARDSSTRVTKNRRSMNSHPVSNHSSVAWYPPGELPIGRDTVPRTLRSPSARSADASSIKCFGRTLTYACCGGSSEFQHDRHRLEFIAQVDQRRQPAASVNLTSPGPRMRAVRGPRAGRDRPACVVPGKGESRCRECLGASGDVGPHKSGS